MRDDNAHIHGAFSRARCSTGLRYSSVQRPLLNSAQRRLNFEPLNGWSRALRARSFDSAGHPGKRLARLHQRFERRYFREDSLH